ncbi:hypothetical protein LA080_000868 [Diaporthe eres]|nr:hypothetical protein LA080_000868 [Diaporthe eres]
MAPLRPWGVRILQSDHDIDALNRIFDSEVKKPLKENVIKLRLRVWEQEHLKERQDDFGDRSKCFEQKPSQAKLEDNWEHDVSPHHHRFPRLIRDYLDSGVLADLIKKHSPKRHSDEWTELAMLIYCAMELGCTLPPGFKDFLKTKCWGSGLDPVGSCQIYGACEQYIDGKPFSFISLDTRLVEESMLPEMGIRMDSTIAKHVRRRRPIPAGLEPLPAQQAAVATEQPAHESRKVEAEASPPPPVEEYFLHFPPDTCANCGADRGYGTPELRRCKGCKTTLYCFEGCQRWHLSCGRHKCELKQDDKDGREPAQGESID